MNYPSNVSDEEWEIIKPYVATSKKGHKARVCRRAIIDALFYQSKTGCQWQYLPTNFPNYKTVNEYYNKWIRRGIWQKLNEELVAKCRLSMGKKSELVTVGIIDSQTVKNTQRSEVKGYDAGKKNKGIKRHIVTDTNGFVLTANVHGANIQDRDAAMISLEAAKNKYPSLQRFYADGGYAGIVQIKCFLKTNALLSIVKRTSKQFKILPIRWIVERTFGWMNNFRRLSKHYEHTIKSAVNQIYISLIQIMSKRLTR